jgi:hypothetical protein
MQTRTYGDLFKITSALIGTGGQLSVTEQDQLSHFINRRFQQAFDESPVWPRYLVSSTVIYKRKSTGRWEIESGVSINIDTSGSIQVDAGAGSTVLFEADSVKKDNPSEVITWTLTASTLSGTPLVVDEQLIPYAQTSKDTIGDFNRIHRKRAFQNNSSMEYDFFVDFNGANILNIANSTDNEAFVSYKKQFTPFTVTSDYYNSAVEVPGEFFNYIAHAVYADFLRVQNRQEQALAEEQVAQTYLALELEKIDIRSNNNTINKRFSTYVNRQSR